MGDWSRPLTDAERAVVEAARAKAHLLYEGREVPHRSCGIAMAETFSRPSASYQGLRRGGITGRGECGVVVAGRLLLGEILGDPDPTGPVTPRLREAIEEFEARWPERIDRGAAPGADIVCNTLTGQFPEFRSEPRQRFCTALASEVAALVAETLLRNGVRVEIAPTPR